MEQSKKRGETPGVLMEYSLMKAAERAGLSKATIHRAVKSGRLSARRGEDGAYRIDASELARVYPETLREAVIEPVRDASDAGETMAVLYERVRSLAAQLSESHDVGRRERETAQDNIADLRRRLDRAEERVLALTTSPAPQVEPLRQPVPRGILSRLFGRPDTRAAT